MFKDETITPTEYYTRTQNSSAAEISRLSRRVATVSWIRLAVAIATIMGIWWLWGDTRMAICVAASGIIVFLLLVKLHDKLFSDMEMQKSLNRVAGDNLRRMRLDLDGMDGGDEYIDPRHTYSYDLDLFGRRSVFSLINSTATPGGRELLARNMTDTTGIVGDIEQRQQAIKELSHLHDFRTRLQAFGLTASNGNDGKGNDRPMAGKIKLQRWQHVAIYLFPTALALLIVLAVMGLDVAIYIETVAIVSILTASIGSKQIGVLHSEVEKIVSRISIYHNLLNEIEQRQFTSPMLKQLQRDLGCGGEKASAISHKLSKLLNNLDQRYNWLSYILLNTLLQWDYLQARNVVRWMQRYSSKLDEWEAVLSRIDELCSLATFTFCNPGYTFPSIDRDGKIIIEAKQLGHPLIPAGKCVCNEVSTLSAGNFMVVTGANMAGKSTYLRTVGVNYLLALIGAPVFASEMTVGVAALFTGLRTTDSLNDNESYFFAELRRLQSIVDRAAKGERMLIILDEILKGTNSTDKQKGSLALVSKLSGMNVAGIIATHDLVLGTLADRFPDRIFNRCFEAEIDGDTLKFDYILHPGIAQNLNAYFLMQHMGIV